MCIILVQGFLEYRKQSRSYKSACIPTIMEANVYANSQRINHRNHSFFLNTRPQVGMYVDVSNLPSKIVNFESPGGFVNLSTGLGC